jgi:hypothetical protein
MSQRKPLEHGQRFGRWTVEHPGPSYGTYSCRCDCGTERLMSRHALVYGDSLSCGCLKRDAVIQTHTTHGESRTSFYYVWQSMIRRCDNPNGSHYSRYGGRGILVCPEWRNSYEAFRDWSVANGYAPGLTIDRKDNDGPYSPSNCRWVTHRKNTSNTGRTHWVTAFGETKAMAEWPLDTRCVVCYSTLRYRLKTGWAPEQAITCAPA